MDRLVMHVDMDAFFASVEQNDHEEYRGKPLIVGGLAGRGVVSTCSYEARRFGVHSAMPMVRARQLCPQGIFLAGNYRRYAEVSAAIFAIFARYSPVIEPLSIDEAFLDLTGMEYIMGTPIAYARRLKAEIRAETGIVASVGIAPNKFGGGASGARSAAGQPHLGRGPQAGCPAGRDGHPHHRAALWDQL